MHLAFVIGVDADMKWELYMFSACDLLPAFSVVRHGYAGACSLSLALSFALVGIGVRRNTEEQAASPCW